ncbi:MAG: tetratricopeptide repeat protein [Pseudomonadota bacterium]
MRVALTLALLVALALACAHGGDEQTAPPVESAPTKVPPSSPEDMATAEEKLLAGRTLAAEGKHGQALPYFEAATALYPGWAIAHLEEASCRMVLNQDEAAIARPLEKARQLAPSNPRVHYALGLFHENFGREAAARKAYRAALSYRSSYPDALYRLALLEEISGALKPAREAFDRAYSLNPDNTAAGLGAARLAERQGDIEHAERTLELMARRFPDNLSFRQQLADLYERSGQGGKAKKLRAEIAREARPARELRPLKPSRR